MTNTKNPAQPSPSSFASRTMREDLPPFKALTAGDPEGYMPVTLLVKHYESSPCEASISMRLDLSTIAALIRISRHTSLMATQCGEEILPILQYLDGVACRISTWQHKSIPLDLIDGPESTAEHSDAVDPRDARQLNANLNDLIRIMPSLVLLDDGTNDPHYHGLSVAQIYQAIADNWTRLSEIPVLDICEYLESRCADIGDRLLNRNPDASPARTLPDADLVTPEWAMERIEAMDKMYDETVSLSLIHL